jgi:hypothetical protein
MLKKDGVSQLIVDLRSNLPKLNKLDLDDLLPIGTTIDTNHYKAFCQGLKINTFLEKLQISMIHF